MIKRVLLGLALIHFAPLFIVIWLELFDLIDMKYGQYNALILTTVIGVLCLLALVWRSNEQG